MVNELNRLSSAPEVSTSAPAMRQRRDRGIVPGHRVGVSDQADFANEEVNMVVDPQISTKHTRQSEAKAKGKSQKPAIDW